MTNCTCDQSPLDQKRVEQMLKLARTKADLTELVEMLDRTNSRLRRIIHRQSIQLHKETEA